MRPRRALFALCLCGLGTASCVAVPDERADGNVGALDEDRELAFAAEIPDDDDEFSRENERDIKLCVAAIAWAAGSAAIPLTNAVKLRRFLLAAGSSKRAALIMLRAKSLEDKIKAVSKTVAGAGSAVLGIDQIREKC